MSNTNEIDKTKLIGIVIGFLFGGFIYMTGNETQQLLGIFIIIVVLISFFSDL
ncbi:MAG: hypothetical protein K0B07_03505 [DPANN group archaeon]|nr:hypothetical protein [DPANN group archaeon]